MRNQVCQLCSRSVAFLRYARHALRRHARWYWVTAHALWGLGVVSWALWSWPMHGAWPLTALGLLPVVLVGPVLLAGLRILAARPVATPRDVRAVFVQHLAQILDRPPVRPVLVFGLHLATLVLMLMAALALEAAHPLLTIFAFTPLVIQRQIMQGIRPKEET